MILFFEKERGLVSRPKQINLFLERSRVFPEAEKIVASSI
jgi:hypothetical protein